MPAAPHPTLLLRSSWQTENIGDIAHTPGALRALERNLPGARLILWPVNIDEGVRAMLRRAFPRVEIVEGTLGDNGKPTGDALRRAFDEAGAFLHGSGPGLVARREMAAWRAATGKPYGVFGTTISPQEARDHKDLLSGAAFVFCRDTASLKVVRDAGIAAPVVEFGPDATFAFHLRDDAAVAAYLRSVGLEEGKFVCAIPRLRYTPYHKIKKDWPHWDAAKIREVEETNAATREPDHAKLRGVMVRWVRETGRKVLACPEMTYQVPLAKELLVDPLPDDVKPKVVWRDHYWRPDEAAAVYARAAAIVSFEMHSPILALGSDTPALHVRQPTDTSKAQMWRDVGLSDWLFEIDAVAPDGREVSDALLRLHADPKGSRAHAAAARERAMGLLKRMAEVAATAAGGT